MLAISEEIVLASYKKCRNEFEECGRENCIRLKHHAKEQICQHTCNSKYAICLKDVDHKIRGLLFYFSELFETLPEYFLYNQSLSILLLTANGFMFFRFNELDNLGKILTKFSHRRKISRVFSRLSYGAIIFSFFIAAVSLLWSGFKYETITRFAYRLTLVSEEIDVKTIASRYKNQSRNNNHLQEDRSHQENEKPEKNNKSTLDNSLSKYKKSEDQDKEQRYMDMGRVFMSNWWVKWVSLCFLIFGLIFRASVSFTTKSED